MKKLIAVFLFLTLFNTNTFADEDAGYWPRSYYAGFGFSAVATRGDIGNYTLNTKTEDGEKETVHLPTTNLFVSPDFILGVNIAQFSLALNYNYWYFTDNLAGFPENNVEEQIRIWRLGIEFIYNIFWPEFFQPGIGLGYAYTSIKTDNSVIPADESKEKTDSELMGSSIAMIFDIRYFLTDHIILVPTIKFYESWFSNLYTENAGTKDLKHKQWQTFAVIEMAILYQF